MPAPERPNSRNLIGMLALLIFLLVYGGLIGIIHDQINHLHVLILSVFYAVAGLVWLYPAYWLIRWMLAPGIKPDGDS